MRRIIALTIAVLVVGALHAWPVHASTDTWVRGGGTGTFGADLDLDGDVDGSQFAFAVHIGADSSARGRFVCLMAGRSDFLGLSLMSVNGPVSSGSIGPGSATFAGTARINLGGGEIIEGVAFEATVSPGGPGAGTLRLTVIGAFDGVAGDTIPGNGNYDLPVETVVSGRISMS